MAETIPLTHTRSLPEVTELLSDLQDTDLLITHRLSGPEIGTRRINVMKLRHAILADVNSYVYIAYADDETGTGFTTIFDPQKDWIAIVGSPTSIATPTEADFAGRWKFYGNQDLDGGSF